MLPPGHIAAGYLTAQALLAIVKPNVSQAQCNQLLLWGAFWGFAPDLDTFVAFARAKAFTFKAGKSDEVNHRKFSSHAPVLWMLAGFAAVLFAPGVYWKLVGLLLWLASWSHFFLDTIQYGIMWTWPVNRNIYAFKDKEYSLGIYEQGFFSYWIAFLKAYQQKFRLTFYLELAIIFTALYVAIY